MLNLRCDDTGVLRHQLLCVFLFEIIITAVIFGGSMHAAKDVSTLAFRASQYGLLLTLCKLAWLHSTRRRYISGRN